MVLGGVLSLAVPLLWSCGEPEPPPGPQNVLFILVDDLNTRLGSYGDSLARTPNIDRLAERGVRFDRAYAQFPLCSPSRASLLSGRYPEATGVWHNNSPWREVLGETDFLPEHFMRHGYTTARVGKLAHRARTLRWTPSEAAWLREGLSRISLAGGLPLQWHGPDVEDSGLVDGRTALRAIEFLEQPRTEPFFLAVGFVKPHLPFQAPLKYHKTNPPHRFRFRREDPRHLDDVPEIALTHNPAEQAMSLGRRRRAVSAYYACVEYIDAQVGLLMEAMDRANLWENTIVVFASDHGFHLGEHAGLWRKGTLFEESLRVPLIVVAPRKPAGAVVPGPVELVDLFPTLTELAGIPTPGGLHGASLVPVLREPEAERTGQAYSTVRYPPDGRTGWSIRTNRYRYAVWEDEEQELLYDHRKDPWEQTNLANDPERARTLAKMRRLLTAKRASVSEDTTERGSESADAP